jgi:hypothetical protein
LQRFYGCIFASASFERVNQKLVLAVYALTHISARLLLLGKPFPEEVAAAGCPQTVIRFNGEEFANTLTNVVTDWNAVEIVAGVESLFFDPSMRSRRILVFEPAIRIRHGYTV